MGSPCIQHFSRKKCKPSGFANRLKLHPRTSMNPKEKLWMPVFVLCAFICLSPNLACAQDGRSDLPDSPSASAEAKHGSQVEREATWGSVPRDFLHDQKGIWLFPTQLAK